MKQVHGILNIIGWGTLLPIGVIIARSFRKFPLKCEEWYNLHILCQTLGYIVGAVGWGIGIWLGNSTKQYTLKTHRIFGIIIFTFATVQVSKIRSLPVIIYSIFPCLLPLMPFYCNADVCPLLATKERR